jgi:hypothetical protein
MLEVPNQVQAEFVHCDSSNALGEAKRPDFFCFAYHSGDVKTTCETFTDIVV